MNVRHALLCANDLHVPANALLLSLGRMLALEFGDADVSARLGELLAGWIKLGPC